MTKTRHKGLAGSFVIIIAVLLIDQLLKIWVKTHFTLGQELSVCGNWFKLLFIENPGMAFGWMGGGGTMKALLRLFRIVAVVVLLIVLFRLSRKNTKFGVLFGIALIALAGWGAKIAFDRMRQTYLHQCCVTNAGEQVEVVTGKIIPARLIVNHFGLTNGVNLALAYVKEVG